MEPPKTNPQAGERRDPAEVVAPRAWEVTSAWGMTRAIDADIVGRDDERASIERILDSDPPRTLVLEGEAGIGKSTLWAFAVGRAAARGAWVVSWRASEAEQDLAFVVLAALFADPAVDSAIGRLSAPRRRALETSLARVEGDGASIDPGTVGLAVADVFRAMANERPLMIAIDDLQWCDAPSRDAIAFASRRLGGAPVTIVLSQRTQLPMNERDHVPRLPERTSRIEVGPLSAGAIGRVIHTRQGTIHPRPLLVRIHAASGGNPFVALETSRSLGARGFAPAPDEPFPVPPQAVPLVRDRLATLSRAARRSLVVVAMARTPTLGLLERVLGDEAGKGVDEGCRSGVLVAEGDGLHSAHPLFGSTADADTPPAERRALRLALAEATDDPVERALLLASTVDRPDAGVSIALAEAAQIALGRGAPAVAGTLFSRGAALAPEPDRRMVLLMAAADSFVRAGDPGDAEAIIRDVLAAIPTGTRRVECLLALAEIVYVERPSDALPLLIEALDHIDGDDLLEASVHAHIAGLADNDPLIAERSAFAAIDILERTIRTPTPDPDLYAAALLERAYAWLLACDRIAWDDVERALALLSPTGDSWVARRARELASRWLARVGRFEEALALELAEHDRLAERGAVGLLPPLLQSISVLEQLAGDWKAARRHAMECVDLVEEGEEVWRHRAEMAWGRILAWEGQLDAARVIGLRAVEREEVAGDWWEAAIFRAMIGFVELSVPDPAESVRHLTAALEHATALRVILPSVFRFEGDLVEAAVLAGDLELAERVLQERLEGPAERVPAPWIVAVAARCRGLVSAARGRPDEALEWYDRSLASHGPEAPMPFEQGRTLFCRGQARRRAGQQAAARADLTAASVLFDRLGAAAWQARAHDELRRIAGRAPSAMELTASELRVAGLAAVGRSNREIAAQLVVSIRTVESQLSAAYGKLGVHKRSQLATALASAAKPPTN